MTTISRDTARAMAIAATGLSQRPAQPTKAHVWATLERLAIIQIDTIHVVARSPYLVLWSRLGDYEPAWFDELHYPDGRIFEYWAHAASFLPIHLWPLLRPAMLRYHEWGWGRAVEWMRENAAALEHVLTEIRAQGPLRSADFKDENHSSSGWWNWKPAKQALDMLWSSGQLMIKRRINFQRVYELTERMLPDWDDAQAPDYAEAQAQLSMIALKAMGLATARQLADYFRQPRTGMAERLERWVTDGAALRINVEGWDDPAYVHPDHAEWLHAGPPTPQLTTLLSPFDNLIWDRERTAALWDFDYKIECYTPAAKRRYGYFSLPILWRDQLVGRIDAKAERKSGIMRIFAAHLEPDVALSADLIDDLKPMLRDFARWHGTPELVIEQSDPPELRTALI